MRSLTVLVTALLATAQAATPDLATRWAMAFNAGPEAMRVFYTEALHTAALARKPVTARMATYADARARLGDVKVESVGNRTGGLVARYRTADGTLLVGEFEVRDGRLMDLSLRLHQCHGGGNGCEASVTPPRGGPAQ